MSDFQIHDLKSAPEGSRPLLEKSVAAYRMIPNLHGVMAESPALLEAYQTLHGLAQKTSFDKSELTVVWQSINVEHECHYCVPAHTAIANSMGVATEITKALRNETPLPNERLETLRSTTLAVVRERGDVSDEVLSDFYAAGFTKQHLLEIILVLSQKVISNYVNHVAETPVDAPFQKFDWQKATAV